MSSDLAQEEVDRYFSNKDHLKSHPEDLLDDRDLEDSSNKDASQTSYLHDDAEGSDEDALHELNRGRMATATATYTLPSTLFDANTGPKGVIADAASFEKAKKKSFRKTLIDVATSAYPFSRSPPKSSLDARSESAERSASELDEEEDFMRRWRENRLRELQASSVGQRRASPSKRRYGSFDDVDAIGYLDAVEKVSSDTIVVVCLYDPEVSLPSHPIFLSEPLKTPLLRLSQPLHWCFPFAADAVRFPRDPLSPMEGLLGPVSSSI